MIVMIVCHFDDTNPIGGLEKQTRLLGWTLHAMGEPIVILSSTRKRSRAGWLKDQGVPVRLFWTYASPQVSGRYLPAALIWAFQLMLWIWWHHKEVTLIHCHQIRIHAFVAALARRLFGIPVIVKSAVGGPGADIKAIGSHKYFGAAGRRFLIRHTDRFIATTESIRADLIQWRVPESKIAIIPNGLELPPGSFETVSEERRSKWLFLGRIAGDKNVLPLANAAIEATANKHVSLDYYGIGPEQARLESLLASRGDHRVRFRGWVDDPSAILAEYGYLLLPSDGEGLSNSMIEAMSQGVVPVSTRVSGSVDHIVEGETGFFFDGVSEAQLHKKLCEISQIPFAKWRELSATVRAYARSRFDIGAVARSYRKLYSDLRAAPQRSA